MRRAVPVQEHMAHARQNLELTLRHEPVIICDSLRCAASLAV